MAVSHLETDQNVPSERTVAILAGLFHMEPHDLVAGTSYPVAKSDRLPLVVNRWTEVDHQLALFERDLWWMGAPDTGGTGGVGAAPGAGANAGVGTAEAHRPAGRADQVLADWDASLAKLAGQVYDRSEAERLAVARRRLADLRRDRP